MLDFSFVISLSTDGSYCRQDKECISDHCINNKCTPYVRGDIGSECKQDDQCISNYCDLKENKCKVYDYQNDNPEPNITFRKRKILPSLEKQKLYHPYK